MEIQWFAGDVLHCGPIEASDVHESIAG